MFQDISEFNTAIGFNTTQFDPNADANIVSQIISSLLPYLFAFAGLILFGMFIAGGFTLLTAATDPKKAEAGKQRITHAIIGFIIIFAAYWFTQILQIILGVNIL